MAKVKAVCLSKSRGAKLKAGEIILIKNLGVDGDFHAKGGERQISFLAQESVEKMKNNGLKLEAGAFGENIVTEGIDLPSLKLGQKIKIGETEMEITKIGKECVKRCEIYFKLGDCIMPREGIFAKVINGGKIKPGDEIKI